MLPTALVLLVKLVPASTTAGVHLQIAILTSADFTSSSTIAFKGRIPSEDLVHPYSCLTSSSSLDSYSLDIAAVAFAIASSYFAGD